MATAPNPIQTQQPDAPQSVWGRIGAVLPGIANRVAAALGNYRPLLMEQQQNELNIRNKLANSQLQTADINRQYLQKQLENYQTPEQVAQTTVNVKRAETPSTYQTDEGQIGIADTDLQGRTTPRMVNVPNPEIALDRERTADFNRNFPGGAVPTMPATLPSTVQRPATMPQSVGFHIQDPVTGVVYEYGKSGPLMGTAPGPPNPNAPVVPGMGKVNAIDAGAAGALPPNPKDYPHGAQDPKFRSDYRAFLASASAAKQKNAMDVANARAAAFGQNRPVTALDNAGQDVVTTMSDWRREHPNQPMLAGNQSGAAGLGQKRATFAEVDKNLANVKQYLPSLTSDVASRAAFAAALTPGTGMVSNIAEATGLKHLNPDQQNLIFAIRNLRQGATSLKNVLSSNGVSDKRVAILESELPNEADLLTGDQSVLARKLATFESVYNELKLAYPQLMSSGAGAFPNAAPVGPLAPPTSQPRILVEGKDF